MSNVISEVEQDASSWSRAIVAKRILIVTVVTVIIQLALNYGWVTPDISGNVLKWLNEALDALAALTAVGLIHPVVTPVADPRSASGEKLVPASTVKVLEVPAVAEEPTADEVAAAQAAKEAANTPVAAPAVVESQDPAANADTADKTA